MLHRYSVGDKVNAEDGILLAQLLQRHPEAEDKIGAGVDYFYIIRNPYRPNNAFCIQRKDDTSTEFSFYSCIKGTKPTAENYFYRACAYSVSEYLTEEKNRLLETMPTCPLTGQRLTKENSEYRHTSPPLKDLIKGFATENRISIDFSLFPSDRDMQMEVKFLDPSLHFGFIDYHKRNANMALALKERANHQ